MSNSANSSYYYCLLHLAKTSNSSMPQINMSYSFLTDLHLFFPATSHCTSCGAFLLCGLWAHGDWQASLWQVWTGAISTHPVRFGKEVSTHVLAGIVDIQTPIRFCWLVFTVTGVAPGIFPEMRNSNQTASLIQNIFFVCLLWISNEPFMSLWAQFSEVKFFAAQ